MSEVVIVADWKDHREIYTKSQEDLPTVQIQAALKKAALPEDMFITLELFNWLRNADQPNKIAKEAITFRLEVITAIH